MTGSCFAQSVQWVTRLVYDQIMSIRQAVDLAYRGASQWWFGVAVGAFIMAHSDSARPLHHRVALLALCFALSVTRAALDDRSAAKSKRPEPAPAGSQPAR